jgi:hypothetical protein
MAVLSRDDFFNKIQARVGDDVSDEAMSFIEDMTDTFNDMETKATGAGKYTQEDMDRVEESWKAKYKHRFFNGGSSSVPPVEETTEPDLTDEEKAEEIKIEDLFD